MDITSFVLGMKLGKSSGGGASPDVRYVTFMNGDAVLYVKPVAVGDDCVDVLTKGLISKPTKESTVQYDYSYSGWSIANDNTVDSNALKAVTEDRTVYACYTSATRKYNISFYDGDTLLTTLSVAYGSTPAYTTEKEGFSFDGWNPEIVPVTGDAVYQAKWIEAITFAGSSWADIARISESGEAQNYFAVGDRRIEVIGDTEVELAIADFNYDVDGNGNTVGMTIVAMDTFPKTQYNISCGYNGDWTTTAFYTETNNIENKVSSALKSVVKEVKKKYLNYSSTSLLEQQCKFWCISLGEFTDTPYFEYGNNNNSQIALSERSQNRTYKLFETVEGRKCPNRNTSDYYHLRSHEYGTYQNWNRVHLVGGGISQSYFSSSKAYIRFGFCV